jgi:hypothetical protein
MAAPDMPPKKSPSLLHVAPLKSLRHFWPKEKYLLPNLQNRNILAF